MAAGPTFEPIATTTLGSAAATITFSSIAATYTDLRLVIVSTDATTAGDVVIQFNGDTATNYSYTYLGGNGTAAASGRATGASNIDLYAYGFPSLTVPTLSTVDIFSYAGSTYKTVLYSTSSDLNGSGGVSSNVGLWRSTAAITSILIKQTAANLNTGTTATIYGIKSA